VSGHDYDVTGSREVFSGGVIRVRSDTVAMPGGSESQRDVVVHPGAVGVVALDDADRVLILRQYRHPVGRHLLELPAGLLDAEDEPALAAAQRELAEEAGLAAQRWDVLVDAVTSPGMSDEAIRVYLARDVRSVEQPETEHEEAEMTSEWMPLAEAVDRILAGEIENAMAVCGLLAAAEARRRGYAGLRAATSAWPAKPHLGG
jgi:8-oxo-dGDP phosphatase